MQASDPTPGQVRLKNSPLTKILEDYNNRLNKDNENELRHNCEGSTQTRAQTE